MTFTEFDVKILTDLSNVFKAMDAHAKNLAVEFYIWMHGTKIDNREELSGIIVEFMNSEYLKERTEG